jgi:hypothetical protein
MGHFAKYCAITKSFRSVTIDEEQNEGFLCLLNGSGDVHISVILLLFLVEGLLWSRHRLSFPLISRLRLYGIVDTMICVVKK